MAPKRARVSASSFIEMPPERRPAIGTVDALTLYQDMVHMRQAVPEEVRLEAVRQANEGVSDGWIAYPEEYEGRIRLVVTKKG